MTSGVATVVEQMRIAWRTADIETYVAAFDDDADLVNRAGKWYRGRADIANVLRELARSGRPALFAAERRTESIRMVTPAVAIVHELWLEPDRTAHATYVFAQKDDGWRVTLATVVLRS
jgi:uncharacterized protein (TIGR02246 family)